MTPRTEYWVMRVVLHHGRSRDLLADIATRAMVSAGTYHQLPSGDICEPVEVFDDELSAREHARRLVQRHPGEDFRIVMNTDAVV